MTKKIRKIIIEILAVVISAIIFLVPFYFVIINSFKNEKESSWMQISFPKVLNIIENYTSVLTYQKGIVIRAFMNSTIITFFSIVVLIIVCSMAAFVLQRRADKYSGIISFFILAGLIVPPSIVPTYWVLNALHIFKTIPGMVLVEVALTFSFSTMLYQGFMGTIPVEIDEAATIDGCGRLKLFFLVIFPLLKPVTATITVLSAVNIFNDFVNPLYFLPGAKNATVQLTLYYFTGKYSSSWNLLFADVVLISLPPLILYIIFNKKIVAGMTAGAVKG